MQNLKIGQRDVGAKFKPYVIAEIAQAHDGSLGYAHSFIDLAKECGADAVKFQTHIAHEETTWDEEFRVNIFPQDKTRYEYWKRMQFTAEEWLGLFNHAENVGIEMLSSAFSTAAINLLDKLGMKVWKVASGEITNIPLLHEMAKTGKPILLSSGMGSYDEVQKAVDVIRGYKIDYGIFQCTSKYPTPVEETGLNIIKDFSERYSCPVGLSDHSATPYVPIIAMAQGASMIEAHLCFHPLQFGPDTNSSLTPEEFRMVCEARDVLSVLNNSAVNKDKVSEDLERTRSLFNKSIALRQNQPSGTILTKEMLTLKKPGSGIPYEKESEIIGRRLITSKSSDTLLKIEDLEA